MSHHLTRGQHEALRRRVHRHVRRLLNDVESFKVNPHGVGGVGEATVRESIGGEQIAEFVVPARLGNADHRYQGGAHDNDAKSN